MTPDPRFRIFGSRSMPKEEDLHAKPTGEWNHYRITALDGSVTLEVNGHVVTAGSQCTPAKGYLCLESTGSEVHFRNFRIWELPAGSHAADENRTAHKATSHKPLYNGLDLDDWNVREGQWKAEDWRLTCAAASGEIEVALPKKAGHLFFDFKRANRSGGSLRLPFRIGNARFDQVGKGDGKWLRVHVHLTDSEVAVEFGGLRQVASRKKKESLRLTLVNDGAATEFCNVFARAE